MKEILHLLNILENKEKKRLLLMLFVMIINGVLQVMSIISVLPFISLVANPEVVESNKYLSEVYSFLGFTSIREFIIFLGFVVLIFLFINNAFNGFTTWLQVKFTQSFQRSLGVKLLKKYLDHDYEFFVNSNSSNLIRKILDDANSVADVLTASVLDFLTNSIITGFIIVIIIVSDPILALSLFAFLGVVYGLLYFFNNKLVTKISYKKYHINRARFKVSQEMLSGIKDIKLLGLEAIFLSQFSKTAKEFSAVNSKFKIISKLPPLLIDLLLFGGLMIIVLYLLITRGNIQNSLPLITLYAFSAYRIKPSVQLVFSSINAMNYHRASLEEVAKDLLKEKKVVPSKNGQFENFEKLELQNISFQYSGRDAKVLDDLSLTVKSKTIVGFVGSTGSGKTTLVDVLMGLLVPQTGVITVDDKVVDESYRRSWQNQIGYVAQNIFLTDDTITRNISYGVEDKEIDIDQVQKVSRIANIHSFIEKMPEQYDSHVGERGVKLSGGQRQRIGIARALYRNPKLLILDEATSALDGITESEVIEAINNLEGKMTIIMIAHRLTTLKKCDVIYFMSKGRIVDSGTYQELIAGNEQFKLMAKENIVQ